MKRLFGLMSLCVFFSLSLYGQVHFTNAGGDKLWSNPLNWEGGVVPKDPNLLSVIIPSGKEALLDINARVTSLQVESTAKVLNNSAQTHSIDISGNVVCNGVIGDPVSYNNSNIILYFNGFNSTVSGTGTLNILSISRNSQANPTSNLTIQLNAKLFSQSDAIYSTSGELNLQICSNAAVTTSAPGKVYLSKNTAPGITGTVNLYVGDDASLPGYLGPGHLITGSIVSESTQPLLEVIVGANSSIEFTAEGWVNTGSNVTITTDPAGKVTYAMKVNIKILLQGPFRNGSMSTALRDAGYIPLSQPYNSSPWNYTGTETVSSVPLNAVDWVLVELRTGTSAPTKAARKAGFLLSDGTLKDTDGSSMLSIPGVTAGNYYVAVYHRNHLAVMSSLPVAASSSPVQYDFSSGISQYYGSDAKSLGSGKYGMYAGDANSDGQITSSDFNIYNPRFNNAISGYDIADWNLDGQVTSPDFNIFNPNFYEAKTTKVP